MTPDRLREIYGTASPRAAAKVLSRFDHHCRCFIENSTFLVLATAGPGGLDVSPKGDPAGFVKLEDDQTLLLPDRPGNNRIDGLMNIASNPLVGLIFLIPSVDETLRVNGRAEISEDAALCGQFSVNWKPPKTVLRITASEVFIHCGKAPARGGLWQPTTWPSTRPVASLNEMVRDHASISG